MFIKPITVNEKHEDSDTDVQIEKAQLHENVCDLVHIERIGAKWEDLFNNIHYPIDYSQISGFIDGKQLRDYQSPPINEYNNLVIFIGSNDPKLLQQAVTKDYLINIAKKSSTCAD